MLYVLIWLVFAFIAGGIASGKDRSFWGFFFLGILFGPLAILGAVVTGKGEKKEESE